jgi:DUF971 family protein
LHSVDTRPLHLDLKKDRGLTIEWADGAKSFYSVPYLRKHSPSADNRQLQREMQENPLTVLPSNVSRHEGPLTIVDAEFVGNYAIRLKFSDGHATGIYSWQLLRRIAPEQPSAGLSNRSCGEERMP